MDIKKTDGRNRVFLLDEIRGFAILCMVVYHAMFNLKYEFGVDVPIFFTGWFDIIRDIFAGGFVFISGIMCRYSRDNVRRGAKCFMVGMVITFVTPFFSEGGIYFGILHMLGVSMMLYGLLEGAFERVPPFIGLAAAAVLAVFTWNSVYGYLGVGDFSWSFPEKAKEVGVLFPFGIIPNDFYSADYFPLLPWFFVFLAGSYLGYWFKSGDMPRCFYNSHCRWLAAVGRATIWIYIVHVPIIYGIFSLIFG